MRLKVNRNLTVYDVTTNMRAGYTSETYARWGVHIRHGNTKEKQIIKNTSTVQCASTSNKCYVLQYNRVDSLPGASQFHGTLLDLSFLIYGGLFSFHPLGRRDRALPFN